MTLPLGVIWAKFPAIYSARNTIMFDDLRRNLDAGALQVGDGALFVCCEVMCELMSDAPGGERGTVRLFFACQGYSFESIAIRSQT